MSLVLFITYVMIALFFLAFATNNMLDIIDDWRFTVLDTNIWDYVWVALGATLGILMLKNIGKGFITIPEEPYTLAIMSILGNRLNWPVLQGFVFVPGWPSFIFKLEYIEMLVKNVPIVAKDIASLEEISMSTEPVIAGTTNPQINTFRWRPNPYNLVGFKNLKDADTVIAQIINQNVVEQANNVCENIPMENIWHQTGVGKVEISAILLERVQQVFVEQNLPAEIIDGAIQLVPPPEIIAAYAELEKVKLLRKAISAAATAYIADMKQLGKEVTAQQALTAGENAVLLENNKIQVWRGSGMQPHVLQHLERDMALQAVNAQATPPTT
ncbi:MAG: hypothetical protein RIT04_139 [Candidatus Parcubacteria bacterium]|jgi:hypothetical protein